MKQRPDLNDTLQAEGADAVRDRLGKAKTYNGPSGGQGSPTAVTLDDFYAYMPMHNYIYTPSREPWPGSSVNARIPPIPVFDKFGNPVLNKKGEQEEISASAWLDQSRPVEQMTWAPGLPMIIRDRLVSAGGWIERKGVSCFNLYRPPEIKIGDATQVEPWLTHVRNVYGEQQVQHIILWLAHRVQRPQEKINHALVLGGAQGIGKDTLLEPVKRAVGPWNFSEVTPQQMFGRFNGYVKSVIASEDAELADVLDRLGNPAATTLVRVQNAATGDFEVWLRDRKHRRQLPFRFEQCGYVPVRNEAAKDGLWVINKARQVVYAKAELALRDRLAAAEQL
jgi:hypothetical protein